MAIICWGNLAKSADSTEKIEQSIEAYVESHNENPNAHQIEGSSLYMHRINEMLDHANGSVQMAHLSKDSHIGMSAFESLDAWNTLGIVNSGIFGAQIQTDIAGDGDTAYMVTNSKSGSPYVLFESSPFFQTTIRFGSLSNVEIYITVGDVKVDPDGTTGFGFKIVNDQLYAWWNVFEGDNTELLQTIVPVNYTLRCYMDSELGLIYFYVNGVLKYTANTGIIYDGTIQYFLYWIKTTDGTNKAIYPKDWLFQQDR